MLDLELNHAAAGRDGTGEISGREGSNGKDKAPVCENALNIIFDLSKLDYV